MILRFAYVQLLYILLPLLSVVIVYRWFGYKRPRYQYPLSSFLYQQGLLRKSYRHQILFFLRALSLFILALLIARPQWVDKRSNVNIEGVDIVLALDVSGSMQCIDDPADPRERIMVAKLEAIRFIEKRTNDPIGVVIFGGEALSLCPLTLDKAMLKEVVGGIYLGFINPAATYLGTGLATAVNRLRKSVAKSKIIILLTDGNPSLDDKISPETAGSLAHEFGIKVYTVAIGGDNRAYIKDPMYGLVPVQDSPINSVLLRSIAESTGGVFFKASSPHDMRVIYNKIDELEKTSYETQLFSRYYEAFLTFIWFFLGLFLLEIVLRVSIWRGI